MSETERIAALKRYTISQITESTRGPLVAVSLYAGRADQKPYIEFSVDPNLAVEIGEALSDVGRKMQSPPH